MRRIVTWMVGGGWAVALVMVAARGDGSPPPASIANAIGPFRELRTWYGALGAGTHLRVDAVGPKLTLDAPGQRFHYDGTDLWMQEVRALRDDADPGPEPVKLPAAYATRLRQVWNEARAGFPNTTFVVQTPQAVDPTWQPDPFQDEVWYRANLPFSWASQTAVHFGLQKGPAGYHLAWVSVVDLLTHRPVASFEQPRAHGPTLRADTRRIPLTVTDTAYSRVDVPLGPDAYRSSFKGPMPVPYTLDLVVADGAVGPYHDAVRRLPLVYQDGLSSGHTSGGSPVPALIVGPTSCGPGEVITTAGTLVWAASTDPQDIARGEAALASCSQVRFDLSPRVYLAVIQGARGCAIGTWEVLNRATTPPTVLSSNPISTCREGPDRIAPSEHIAAVVSPTASLENLGAVRRSHRAHLWPGAGERSQRARDRRTRPPRARALVGLLAELGSVGDASNQEDHVL